MTNARDLDDLLAAAAAFQDVVPGAVRVGGTAAAAHARHRISLDTDHVLADLSERFAALLDMLEQRADWHTARVTPPVVILGNFHGVETTLRQLRRACPLETHSIATGGGTLTLPSLAEMIRVKGSMALTRNAFRDYLDLAALTAAAGTDRTVAALRSFDRCYRDVGRASDVRTTSPLLQLARQLADPRPGDLSQIGEVAKYKGIVREWNSWERIADQCRRAAVWATSALLDVGDTPRLISLARPAEQQRRCSQGAAATCETDFFCPANSLLTGRAGMWRVPASSLPASGISASCR